MGLLVARTETSFTDWQTGIIFEQKRHGKWEAAPPEVRSRVEREQESLREAVSSGHHALTVYLRHKLSLAPADDIQALPFPRAELTPGEVRDPPIELECELGEAWRGQLSPALASQPLFWLLCHLAWFEQGRFGTTGVRLSEAFAAGSSTREGQTRNFLRRTGGIPVVRFKVSVFSDCPMARAWWRWRLAGEVERTTKGQISRHDAHRVLQLKQTVWETVILLSLRQVTVINQPGARARLVAEMLDREAKEGDLKKDDVQEIAQVIAREGLRRSFEHA